jgi:DNA-binding response OmpR family regulator
MPRCAQAAEPQEVASAKRHVLVVEDDSPIRDLVADLLADAGYAVVQASDGLEALQQLKATRPDLIVLDLMLPRMSGWQFLEQSRAELEQGHIPVLILSAIQGRGDYPNALGVAGWFTKPIDMDRFLGAVENLTGPARRVPPNGVNGSSPEAVRVLMVEDEPLIRDLVIDRLAEDGFAPTGVGSIAEARAQLAAERPALIMLDLMLPGQSGLAFLRERGADSVLSSIPVVVVSAAAQDTLLEAKRLGADAFLSKPFDLDAVTALVQSFAPAASHAAAAD